MPAEIHAYGLALCARANRKRGAGICQRFGDDLSHLSVAAHAGHHGDFAF
jgi:hypothetical protein